MKKLLSLLLPLALLLSLTACGKPETPVSYTHLTLPTSDLV